MPRPVLSTGGGFNSTLVRVEVEQLPANAYPIAGFNSTLVRVEVAKRKRSASFVSCFNSTLVRVEATENSTTEQTVNTPFQFHIGSSRGGEIDRGSPAGIAFQFHIGSSRGVSTNKVFRERGCFNSTLVRVEGPAPLPHQRGFSTVSIPHWFE